MQASSQIDGMPYLVTKAEKEVFNMMGRGRERRSKSISGMQPIRRF